MQFIPIASNQSILYDYVRREVNVWNLASFRAAEDVFTDPKYELGNAYTLSDLEEFNKSGYTNKIPCQVFAAQYFRIKPEDHAKLSFSKEEIESFVKRIEESRT